MKKQFNTFFAGSDILRMSLYWSRLFFAACQLAFFSNVEIQAKYGLGWDGPSNIISSNLPAMGRDTFHQTRLLTAPSNLAWNTAREGAATASLGNLFRCLITLRVKNFFLKSSVNLLSFSLKETPLVLSLQAVVKSLCLISHSEVLKGHRKVSPQPSLLQA